ncbi:MAG: hypothetical protein IJS09_03365 [Treponema sp.]|nr:hypothetical protein [Treponema sp.]
MKLVRCILFFFSAMFAVTPFISCHRSNVVASVNEDTLFTLKYGNFEDELNLFNLSQAGTINTYMTMRDGFFYIANGESKKIMELNSYGDLLSLYYNEEVTKNPSLAENNAENSTKKAVSYPFNTLGPIAVDSQKHLYAVDTLPPERQERDTEKRLLLSHAVLRFDSDGSFIDYLGQQGPGGTPFPFIKNMYTTMANELVVVCTTNDGPMVYWFGDNGFLLYTVPFTAETVPNPYKEAVEDTVYISIENVVPDLVSHKLYVKIDYFTNMLDPALKVPSGVDYHHTLLCPLDVTTGRYETPLEIPPYEAAVAEGLSNEVYLLPYDFLGVTESGWFFFYIPTEKGYQVQMVQPNGQRILKRGLSAKHSDILYYAVSLDEEGIISALFIKNDRAEVNWWRTDNLVASFMNN